MTVREDTRGQTLHDFAIGMAIFLLVLGYVFAFVPSLFAPFSPDADSTTVRADRTIDHLTRDVLADEPTQPGTLSAVCTQDFFNDSVDTCGFADQSIRDIAALSPRTDVNVTIQRDGEITSLNGTELARGPSPVQGGPRVVRAARIVSLNGEDHRFVVRLW